MLPPLAVTDHLHFELTLLPWAVMGLIMGSFISMLTWRLPKHLDADTSSLLKSLVFDRSRCAQCGHRLKARQLIPIFSWWYYRQQTPCCQQPISLRYPLIEIVTTALTLAVVGFQPASTDNLLGLTWHSGVSLVFVWSLIAISIIDIEHHLIPDRISLPLLWLGLLINTTPYGFVSLSDAVWGATIGYISLWILFQSHRALTGREGMGYGDFKLTAALGAWLGWTALIPIFILAGSLAIIVMGSMMLAGKQKANQVFAFGPWLALATIIVLLTGYYP